MSDPLAHHTDEALAKPPLKGVVTVYPMEGRFRWCITVNSLYEVNKLWVKAHKTEAAARDEAAKSAAHLGIEIEYWTLQS